LKPITENIIEESAIEILQSQGSEYANGKDISPPPTKKAPLERDAL